MLSPPPNPLGKGGAGGYAPSPNTASVSGGVDTPDYILPPHQAEGNIGAPPEGSTIQILHCSGLPAKNSIPPCVLQPHPWRAAPGYAHATPPVRPMENYEWHYQPKLGSRELLRAWENLVGRGGGEKVLEAVGRWPLHLFQPPCFPGVAEPQRNQAAQIWRVAYSL